MLTVGGYRKDDMSDKQAHLEMIQGIVNRLSHNSFLLKGWSVVLVSAMFALAAKDTLANLFGSVVIFADRPFQIGDWVIISGSEGVIEEVGVRSTKIRTFSDTLITIPNNMVANATIQNISAFRNRRVYLNLGITYNAGPAGAMKAVEIIRNILDEDPRVCDGHYIFFDDFKESSLNLMVYYFVKSTVWREYLTVRGEVNAEIMRRFAEVGIDFAFPTRTIEFQGGVPTQSEE